MMDEKACPIFFKRYFPFWDRLTGAQQGRLCAATRPARYRKGENVHGMGGCTGVLVVETGCLRGYLLSEEGREITLFRAFPGEVCILSAPCALKSFSLDVMIDAEEETSLLVVDGPAFAAVAAENLYAENFALAAAAGRLSDAVWVMQQILFMRFDRRLASFLLEEAEKGGPVIRLTHDQIARYMGSAREVVSRMLRYFAAEGAVRAGRGSVEIADAGKLRKAAGLG